MHLFNWNASRLQSFDGLLLPSNSSRIRVPMDDFEKEMKTCFLDEASQLLEDAEQNFMSLERAGDDIKVIENLFRLAHNLKGGARAVGFSEMAEFTHELESLLLKLKNRELSVESSIVSLLLECNDHLRNSIPALRADFSHSMSSQGILSKIHAAMSGGSAPPATEASASGDVPAVGISLEAEKAMLEAAAEKFEEQAPEEVKVEATPESEPPREISLTPSVEPVAVQKSDGESPQVSVGGASSAPAAPKKAPVAEDESLRVSLKRLEMLINNVGELVILQTVLNQQKYQIQSPLIHRTVGQLAKITKDIQDISMSLRMVPLKQTFQKMQRIVRDTAQALGKNIQFVMEGEHTEIDKTVVDLLGDPLVHLVRNAVDHGIDSLEDRTRLGKIGGGTITLAAFHRGGQIVIEVQDDGRGLDPEKLKAKALEKGIIRPGQNLTNQEAQALIFAPGFSTKAEVTEISGRGVGMDVVKTNIEKRLQGEIELESYVGKGTRVRIKLPLTLAIIDGMVVQAGMDRFVIPLTQVFESLQPAKEDIHHVSGMGDVLSLRGEHLPLYRLSTLMGRRAEAKDVNSGIAIVVRSGDKPFCAFVDDIMGQQQIVIKQLGGEIRGLKGVTGGAILGDGKAALILDLNELVSHRVSGSSKRSAA